MPEQWSAVRLGHTTTPFLPIDAPLVVCIGSAALIGQLNVALSLPVAALCTIIWYLTSSFPFSIPRETPEAPLVANSIPSWS